jgi:GT2 family glycosyltransferase
MQDDIESKRAKRRQKKVLLVPVCYNAHDDLYRFLDSIEFSFNNANVNLQVYISDNSDSVLPKNKLSGYPFEVNYLKNENVGYFPALWRVILNVEPTEYNFIAVSNVDLQLAPDFFENLDRLEDHNSGVIAPSILSKSTHFDQNPKVQRRPSILKILFLISVFALPWLLSFYVAAQSNKRSKAQEKYQDGTKMYAPHGAFMMFTRDFFTRGGKVNYPRFLFSEELFVAEQVRRIGLEVVYRPNLIVFDNEHGSTSQMPSRRVAIESIKSYLYYLRTRLGFASAR